jgi:hypothetical protein
VPELHRGVRDRLARRGIDDLELQGQRRALATASDVAPDEVEVEVEVVGALRDLALEQAARS